MVHPRQTPLKNSVAVNDGSGVKRSVMLTPADRIKRMQDAKRIYNDLSRKSMKPAKPTTPLSEQQEVADTFEDDNSHACFTEPKAGDLAELQFSPTSDLQLDDDVQYGSPPRMSIETPGRLSVAAVGRKSIPTGGSNVRRGPKIVKPVLPGVKPFVFNSLPTPAPQASEESFVPASSVADFCISTPHKGRVSKMTIGCRESSVGRPSTSIATIGKLICSAQENDKNEDPVRRRLCFDDESEIHDVSEAAAESSSIYDCPEPEVRIIKPVALAHSAAQTSGGLSIELISKALSTYTREDLEALRDAMPSPQQKIFAEVFPCEKPTDESSSLPTEEVSAHPTNTDAGGQEASLFPDPHALPMVDTPKSRFPRRSIRIAELNSPALAFADQENKPIDENVKNSNKKKRGGSRSRNPTPAV